MIGTKPKYPKITTELARCLESYIGPDNIPHREGELMASDSEPVRTYPRQWAAAGLGDEAYQTLRQQRILQPAIEAEEALYAERERRQHEQRVADLAEAERTAAAELDRIKALRAAIQ